MANSSDFQATWASYQEAVQELYQAPRGIVAEADRSAGQIYAERLEAGGQQVLAQAASVRDVLEASLGVDDLDQRELASLKLVAAAAYDLSVARDLLDMEGADPDEGIERSGRGAVMAAEEIQLVLAADLEAGMKGLLEVERGALPNESAPARQALENAVTQFLKDIPENAAELSQTAVSGVINLGLGPAQSAASLAVQEILARLPDGASLVVRRAAALVGEAVEKLRAAIGKETEEKIQEETKGWIKDIEEDRDTVTSLLDKLYQTTRIGEEVQGRIKDAPDTLDADTYNRVTRGLEELSERSTKTRKTLSSVMRVLAFVKAPLMAAPPWGTLAIYSAYLGILGYAVYVGGDYLDWYRTGEVVWLDRVAGLRSRVQTTIPTSP